MAVKGNILYADSHVDLVAFDISNPASIHEVGRVENIFLPGREHLLLPSKLMPPEVLLPAGNRLKTPK
jgi:prepilin-type processing-associated H-X9-DG protein